VASESQACWEQLLTDWSADTSVDGRYPVGCYRKAITQLPEDLRAYSSAAGDIETALQKQFAATSTQKASTRADMGGGLPIDALALVLAAIVVLAAASAGARARRRS
jgi:hypothetical protein